MVTKDAKKVIWYLLVFIKLQHFLNLYCTPVTVKMLNEKMLKKMARQKGIIKLLGTVGDITFYKAKEGYLAREKGGVDKDRIMNLSLIHI